MGFTPRVLLVSVLTKKMRSWGIFKRKLQIRKFVCQVGETEGLLVHIDTGSGAVGSSHLKNTFTSIIFWQQFIEMPLEVLGTCDSECES